MNEIEKAAQVFALNEYLNEWPDDKTYEQVIDMLVLGLPGVTVTERFEYIDGEVLVEYIQSTKAHFQNTARNLLRITNE